MSLNHWVFLCCDWIILQSCTNELFQKRDATMLLVQNTAIKGSKIDEIGFLSLLYLIGSIFGCIQREESLKVQFKNLSEELESQRNLHRTTLKRANEAETQLKENQQRVTGLEGELLTSDVERDQLKDDKRKVRL